VAVIARMFAPANIRKFGIERAEKLVRHEVREGEEVTGLESAAAVMSFVDANGGTSITVPNATNKCYSCLE
jgi:hypothetical protein